MIIDTHIHLYDPTRPQGVPWPEPEDAVLYRRVLPGDCMALAEPEGVTGAVVVEASIWPEDNQWVLDLAANEPFIVGLVGNLDPSSAEFRTHLNRLAVNPLFRGIRPREHPWEREDPARVRSAMAELVERDLELDTGVNPTIVDLARDLPELRIVIDHCGCLSIDGGPLDPGQVDLMHRAAALPNVYCKVSGLMDLRSKVQPAPTDLAFYAPALDVLWDAFGEDRLIFGSDWPVLDRSGRSYAEALRLVQAYFAGKGDTALEKCLWRNSVAAYKWLPRSPEQSAEGEAPHRGTP